MTAAGRPSGLAHLCCVTGWPAGVDERAAEQELDVAISAVISLAGTRLAGTIYGRTILRTGSRLRVRQVLRSAS